MLCEELFQVRMCFEETTVSGPTLSGIGGECLASMVCQDGFWTNHADISCSNQAPEEWSWRNLGCLKNTEIMDALYGERLITDAFNFYIQGRKQPRLQTYLLKYLSS